MKKLGLTVMLSLIILGLIFSATVLSADAKVIRVGHIRAVEHPTHQAALKFKEAVEDLSNGKIEVRVFPNSQLGDPKEMFVQMQTGDLEMVYGGINTFAWIKGGEAFEITAIPFIYRSYEHMRKALMSDFFKSIIEKAEQETGIKIVNMNGDTAPRGLTTSSKPVRTADDFKGVKIRTAASPTVIRAMETLGAFPQQVPFADLYMALKTGVVDAQENGAIVVASNSLYEVQDYYMKTDYIRDIETFYMGMNTWNGLSEVEKALIFQATEAAGDYETELTQEWLDSVYETLEKEMTVIVPDNNSIREKLEGVFDDYEGDKWPEGLLEKIKDVK